MKKLGKFIFGTISIATLAGGVFYFLKNFANKTATDDFEDFEDDFLDDYEDDFDNSDTDNQKKTNNKKDSREYVTINITKEEDNPSPEEGTEASNENADSSEESVKSGETRVAVNQHNIHAVPLYPPVMTYTSIVTRNEKHEKPLISKFRDHIIQVFTP